MIEKIKIEQAKINGKWRTIESETTKEIVSYEFYKRFIDAQKFFNSRVKTEYLQGVKIVTDTNVSPSKMQKVVTQFTIDL